MMIMTRRTSIILLSFVVLSFVSALPVATFAATGAGANTAPAVQLVNPLGSQASSLPALVTEIMQFVVRIGAIVVVFMLVYTGYLFVVAQGNEKKITDAREALKWVVIGALILLGAQAISIGICETANALSTGGSVVSCSF